jgi:HEAT repeat protein
MTASPRRRVELECARRGKAAVVSGCIALLARRNADPELIVALGGPPASWALTGEASGPDYWLRVWATRGLLYAWEDRAKPAILRALTDEAWRVREGAVRVAAKHGVDAALPILEKLKRDNRARVRAAALRAVERLTSQPSNRKGRSATPGAAGT